MESSDVQWNKGIEESKRHSVLSQPSGRTESLQHRAIGDTVPLGLTTTTWGYGYVFSCILPQTLGDMGSCPVVSYHNHLGIWVRFQLLFTTTTWGYGYVFSCFLPQPLGDIGIFSVASYHNHLGIWIYFQLLLTTKPWGYGFVSSSPVRTPGV